MADSDKIRQIKKEIKVCLAQETQAVAAFDADGTLWPGDVGITFFKYQIENALLPHLSLSFEEFLNKKQKESLPETLLWMAQVNKGVSLKTLQQWVGQSLEPLLNLSSVFQDIRTIVTYLLKNKVEVYIVSASFKWTLEPLAKIFHIPFKNVLGVTTKVNQGLLTEELDGCITWNQGKVEALLKATKGRKPFLSAGNTLNDLPLLESATHMRLTVASAPKEKINHSSEQALLKIAKERNWHWLSYP